jgi:mortality factor 4-like protein 1
LAENWTEQNTLLGTVGPHYFIHYKGWKQTYVPLCSLLILNLSSTTKEHGLTNRWDEWVPEARLLKLNEAGFNKRKQLADQQTQKSRSIGVGGASPAIKEKGKGKKGAAAESKKRARDSGVESVCPPLSPVILNPDCTWADGQESEYIQKPEVKIVIPDVLKLQLVDDWENVTKNNQVCHFSSSVSISTLCCNLS